MTSTATGISVWNLDPVNSEVEFSVKHMMVSTVKGRFLDVAARIEIDEAEPANSKVEAEIATASVDTGFDQRDNHLRSDDFFNAERFPKLTFRSTKIEPAAEDRWFVTGDLTIRDVSRPVVLDLTYEGRIVDAYGKDRAAFSAHTSISRRDFGVNWNGAIEAGGVVVGDTVKINLEIAAVREE
ncbi:MAG: polyisoprenoid-binding protein [Dehalococcoidia bacterium]|nr:polyisoprenoid-binding protein [Dehalococcoidia bacterium]